MDTSTHKFATRIIVFEESDIFEALRQLVITAKTMDLEIGYSAVLPMKYSRAARVNITDLTSPFSTHRPKDLQPLMFNLTCNFNDRTELIELLKDTAKFVRRQLEQFGFESGLMGDVPSLRHSAPFGAWILTRVEIEPPRHMLF